MKTIKNKVIASIFLCMAIILITGCGNNVAKNNGDSKETVQKSKGKCDVFSCIKKIDADDTVEEMNKIIGFEGELTEDKETYKVYSWDLTDDTSITSQFHLNNNTATITANYPNSLITKKADFSKWDEIKAKLNNRETVTYDEFVKLVGGVEGAMQQKTSRSISYKWLNANGGYLSAYFDIDSKKCTMATGRF